MGIVRHTCRCTNGEGPFFTRQGIDVVGEHSVPLKTVYFKDMLRWS